MSSFDDLEPVTMAGAWNSALVIGADSSYVTPRTADTQTTNAIGSMTPVESAGKNDSWSAWLQDVGKAVVGYSIEKDAQQSGVTRPSQTAPYQRTPIDLKPTNMGGLVMVALAAAAVFVIVKLAK